MVPVLPPADGQQSDLFDAWHAAYLAAECHGRGDHAAPWHHEEVRVDVLADDPSRTIDLVAVVVAGEVVAAGCLELPQRDNREHAFVGVYVAPGRRRRGHGSAVLDHLEARAAAAGRTLLDAEVAWPYEVGPGGEGVPGVELARARGYTLALGDVQRELALPVDDALLGALEAEAAPHHAAYSLRSFVGPVPDELVAGWSALVAQLNVEAPMGELELEAEDIDPGLVRVREETLRRQGRTKYNTVALDAEGTVVAYTDLVTTVHEPGRAYQWGTLVHPDHRGHRLGLAVKVANLRLLQGERDAVQRVTTYNAEVNVPMVEVNDRLGFRPVERLGEFSARLAGRQGQPGRVP